MPDLLFEQELLWLEGVDKEELLSIGLELRELDGEGISEAQAYRRNHARLSFADTLALVLAARIDNALLLSGDGLLRRIATEHGGIEVRGVLWAADQMGSQGIVELPKLLQAYETWRDDKLVFLPQAELGRRISQLHNVLKR